MVDVKYLDSTIKYPSVKILFQVQSWSATAHETWRNLFVVWIEAPEQCSFRNVIDELWHAATDFFRTLEMNDRIPDKTITSFKAPLGRNRLTNKQEILEVYIKRLEW